MYNEYFIRIIHIFYAYCIFYIHIRRAVHTLVCSYAGVSGHPVLTHAVPPQPLHIYSVKNLHTLHIFSMQSLKRRQVTLVT